MEVPQLDKQRFERKIQALERLFGEFGFEYRLHQDVESYTLTFYLKEYSAIDQVETILGMEDVRHVNNLDINTEFLKTLPRTYSKLTNVERFGIYGGRLTSIPDEIAEMSNMVYLDITSIALYDSVGVRTLPASIGRLQKLEHVNLKKNGLIRLPDSINNLVQLKNLDLSRNELTKLPDMSNLTNMEGLYLNFNHLTEVHESIREMKQLQRLWLGANHIEELPEWLFELPMLQTLYITHMPHLELPDWLGELDLKFLNLVVMELNEVPAWVENLDNLTTIKLKGNSIDTLPNWLTERDGITIYADNIAMNN